MGDGGLQTKCEQVDLKMQLDIDEGPLAKFQFMSRRLAMTLRVRI